MEPTGAVDVSYRIDIVEGIFRTTGGLVFATLLRCADEIDRAFEAVEVDETEPNGLVLGGLVVLTSDFLPRPACEVVRLVTEVALGAGLAGREGRVLLGVGVG